MESMTGYSHIEGSTSQFSYTVEIKTLNSKFLEIFVNLPKILSQEDSPINELLREKFTRGKVELSIDLYDWAESRAVNVNTDLMKLYYTALSSFKKEVRASETFSLDTLLSLDGVVQRGRSAISAQSRSALLKAVEGGIKKALAMRKDEGKALEKDLLQCVAVIEKNLIEIKKEAAFSSKERFDKLKERIEKVMGGTIEDSRLFAEVALYADRVDINEEITRLSDHIRKFRETAKEKGQIGKKLDFIAQEMFREANTIGSKTPSSSVAHRSVEVKNNIEKIREQCRNVV
ncbi:MAG TPA: YicC/YloC family endoribonuclease [Spirochaetota bacterium]